MTQDDIIRMAREAGIQPVDRPRVEKFAELVASAEREACAQVCEIASRNISMPEVIGDEAREAGLNVCANLAAAIRARGEKGRA